MPKRVKKKSRRQKYKKTASANDCMYDFIRPKMETYFFPPFGDQKFEFFLFRCFVILQFRARARFFICFVIISTRERAEKKTPKMYKEFKWFKVFRGQVWCARRERPETWSNGSKFINEIFFFLRIRFDGARQNEKNKHRQFFERWFCRRMVKEEEETTTNLKEPLQMNITQFWAADHVWWKRVMLFIMLEKEQRKEKKKCSISGFSRGRFGKNEKIRKYIKFYCFLLRRTRRWRKAKTLKIILRRKRIDGAKKEERWMRKPEALLVHPKIYFMPFAACCCCVECLCNSKTFLWFAFSSLVKSTSKEASLTVLQNASQSSKQICAFIMSSKFMNSYKI